MGFYTKDSSSATCVPTCAPESAPPRIDFVGSGYRYYSPELGRWLSKDPIGEWGGFNPYGFAHNLPVGRIDFRGLDDASTEDAPCCKQEDIDKIIGESPWKTELEAVKKKKNKDGRVCLKSITCGKCKSATAGGEYVPPYTDPHDSSMNRDGRIIICTAVDVNILRHEIQHADQCDEHSCGKNPTRQQCVDALCSEIAAYICGDNGQQEYCNKQSPVFNKAECAKRAWEGSVAGRPGKAGPCPDCKKYVTNAFLPPYSTCNFAPKCVISTEGY